MVKVLRKYSKPIMVVGGSLLMITFLVGGPVEHLLINPERRAVASVDGRTVRSGELALAEREFAALASFAPLAIEQTLGVKDSTHWFLLALEARQSGLVGGPSDASAMLFELTESLPRLMLLEQYRDERLVEFVLNQSPDTRKQLQDQADKLMPVLARNAQARGGLSDEEFNAALAKARGVARMLELYATAHRLSDRRGVLESKRTGETVLVDYALIDAAKLASEQPQPSEEDLKAHFEKYRDVNPGQGEMGFGYRLGSRVKLEWLEVNAQAIRDAAPPDPVQVHKHWLQNRQTYTGEFAAERSRVENDLRQEQLAKILAEIDRIVRGEVLRATGKLPSDGPFKSLPPAEQWAAARPKLESIAQQIVAGVKSATGVTIPTPAVTVKDSGWLDEEALRALPGIGISSLRVGTRSEPFARAALRVRELDPKTDLPVQVGVPASSPASDYSQNRYYFTVLAAREASPPDSLEEVRAKVAGDLRKLRAYEKLAASLEQYKKTVASAGDAPWQALKGLFGKPSPATPLAPDQTNEETGPVTVRLRQTVRDQDVDAMASFGRDNLGENFDRAVLEAAKGLDPLQNPSQYPAEGRVVAVALPGRLAVAVARIDKVTPLTIETLRTLSASLWTRAQQREIAPDALKAQEQIHAAFSPAALMARHAYKSLLPAAPGTPGTREEPASTAPAPTAPAKL